MPKPFSASAHEPTLEVHRLFHRDLEGWVHIQRDPVGNSSLDLDETKMDIVCAGRYCGAFPVKLLYGTDPLASRELHQKLARQLQRDGYIGVHTIYRPTNWPTALDFRRLNAAFVDCDCYDLDYDPSLGLVSVLEAERIVPPVSVIECTGRGLRLYWLLLGARDESKLPPEAFSRNRALLVRINRELVKRIAARFPELAPDGQAVDVTMHQRVAGSINTRNWVTVTYEVRHEDASYPLPELADFLALSTRQLQCWSPSERAKPCPGWVRRRSDLCRQLSPLVTSRKTVQMH